MAIQANGPEDIPYALLEAADFNEYEVRRLERIRGLVERGVLNELTSESKRLEFLKFLVAQGRLDD